MNTRICAKIIYFTCNHGLKRFSGFNFLSLFQARLGLHVK